MEEEENWRKSKGRKLMGNRKGVGMREEEAEEQEERERRRKWR